MKGKPWIILLLFFFPLTNTSWSQNLPSLAPVIREVSSSVVNISTTQIVKTPRQSPYPFDFFKEFFGEDPFGQQRQMDIPRHSLGSGVIISADGYILTNNHVIKDAQEIKIRLHNSKEDVEAKVVGKDAKIDIALLKVEVKQPVPFVPLGDSDVLEVGDWVIAIGNPFGLSHTVTKGIVSAKGRVIGAGPYDDFIQTDAPINFGNSGGPLFNIKGEVVGINTAIVSGGQGIGFAIPVNAIKSLLPQLKEGKVIRAWLGVKIQNVTKEIMESFSLEKMEGALVAEVMRGTPAETAGIKEGDIITEVNGKKVEDSSSLPKMIAGFEPGKKINVVLLREKKKHLINVILGRQGEEEQIAVLEKLGLKLSDTKNGVLIEEVLPQSIAERIGMMAGDHILRINGEKVDSTEMLIGFVSKLKQNTAVTFHLKTRTGNKFISFRMP